MQLAREQAPAKSMMTPDRESGGRKDDSGNQGGSTYRQILKSSAIVGGSSIAMMMIGLARTKVMAMLLGPSGVGLMGALSSVADLARTLAELGINSSGVRQIAESVGTGDTARIALTVTVLRRVALVLGTIGGVLLAVFSGPVATMTFGDDEQAWAVALLGLAVLFRLVADGQGALLQGTRRIGDLARVNILGALAGTALTIGLVFWLRERGIAISLVAIAGASLGISWWYSRQVQVVRVALPMDALSREARALLQLGLAFMTSALLTIGAAYVVRIILIRSDGLDGAGLFQAAWAVGGLYVAFVLQAMGTDFYPRLVAAAENDAECNRLVNEQAMVSLLLGGMGVVATLTLAPWVVTLLYSAKFAAATDMLRWICLGMALRVITWPLGYILVAKGKRAWFVTADLLWTIMYIGLTWLSVGRFGLIGAGIAFFGAYVFHFFVVYPMCRSVSGFRWSRDAGRTAIAFVLTIAAVQAGYVLLPPTPALAFGIAATALSAIASIYALGRLVSPQHVPRRLAWLLRIGGNRSNEHGCCHSSLPATAETFCKTMRLGNAIGKRVMKVGLASKSTRDAEEDLIGAKLDFGDAVAGWFVRQADRELAANHIDESLRLAHIAASVLVRQNRRLVDSRLESVLQSISRRLADEAAPGVPQPPRAPDRPLWLHVLEEALPAGGLTSMATRWIEADSAARTHSVVLMGQRAPVPDQLEQAASRSGGHVLVPPTGASALQKARWLRSVARENAAVVVLHAGVSDAVTLSAFGAAGGPPVLLVNHAAHIYWIGSSVADLIVNCRGSELEIEWTERYRGGPAGVLPITLAEPSPLAAGHLDETATQTRASFGLPASGPVILTIGARFKYGKTADHDFLALIEDVLNRHPDASLLALGVVPDQRWNDAAARVGGRIVATGLVPHADVALAQSIADVYAEGFPFGTTTSLLESGLRGLPAVLAPATCPPPYGSDGVALDGVLDRPADAAEYREQLSKLLGDPTLAQALGVRLASSVREHHTGAGWHRHLSALVGQLPATHAVRRLHEPPRTPASIHAKWLRFVEETDSRFFESLEHATIRAFMAGLRPRFDAQMGAECARAAALRTGQGMPSWCLRLALNRLLPIVPLSAVTPLFRVLAFCWRRRSWRGALGRVLFLTSRRKSRGWYDSYGGTRT